VTSRERVNRLFERRDHDRVPRDDSYWAETIQRWNSEGFVGDWEAARQSIDPDFHPIVGSTPLLYPGGETIVREDDETRVVRDAWGGLMRFWRGRSGTPEHLGWECDSRQTWEQRIKPLMLSRTPDDNFFGGRKLADLSRYFREGRQAGRWVYIGGMETFELTRRLIGDEATLIAMAEDPDWIRDLSTTLTNILLRDLDAAMGTGIESDGFFIYGDMAYNHGTVCSPRMYRDLIWPDHKRLCDWAHARGMHTIYHSDGDVRGVLDLYTAAGFEMLNPLESKAGMNVCELTGQVGDRMAFLGNIDVTVLGTNDREQIEHEVRTKLAAGMRGRCYAYHSDHSVPPTVNWQTYRLVIELLDRYGRYDGGGDA
jgi:uroporphyrinogen decarboxylase